MQKTLKFAVCFAIWAALWGGAGSASAQAPAGQDAALAEIVKIGGQMRQKFAEGKYAEALPLAQREVALWEKLRGKDSGEVAVSLLWVAQLESQLGKQNEATLTYQRALKITDALFGPNHIRSSPIWSGLAYVAREQGRYAEAEAFYRKSIAIDENAPQADVATYWRKVDSLGVVCKFLGKLDEAEALHVRAVAGMELALGPNHPDRGSALINLAHVYQAKTKYPEALELYRQALAIQEQTLPADHPELATALSSLATARSTFREFAEAEKLERRALAIREKSLPADHPEIASSHSNLGTYYLGDNRFKESEECYRRALAIYEKSLPPDHIYLARGLQNLATVLQRRKDFVQADQLYDRALGIYEKALGKDHPDVAACLENFSLSVAGNERWQEAADVIDRARRISRRYVARVLPGLSTKQQFFFLAVTDSDRRMSALSLGLHNRDSAAIAKLSAGWLLNSKALIQQAMTQNVLLARDSGDAELNANTKLLREVRQELARLAMLTPDAEARTEHQQKTARLEAIERELSETVGSRIDRSLASDPWVEVDEVRKAIPADGVLIDIARFYEYDHSAEPANAWKPMRYAAWIIPAAGRGEIQIVDLGEAKPIDDAVKSAIKAMHEAMQAMASEKTSQQQTREIEAEQTIRARLAELSRLVWTPLSAKLGDDAKEILLSPDGALWLAPWNALPVEEGRYLIEKYPVRYLVSGRDIVSKPASDMSPTTPIIFADPNFDLGPAQVNSATRAVLRGNVPAANLALQPFGNVKARSVLSKVSRLEGTAEEAVAIQPTLAEYAHREPVAYLKQFATEGIFKAVKRPQVLVISTHGFFMPEPSLESGDGRQEDWRKPNLAAWVHRDANSVPHPLLRCGLLLAGCNQTSAGQSDGALINSFDDGILTGMEIVGVDLRGTELVVLSACDTGVGEVQYGEGVSGLRQAFQLAGAKSVVATLWQIPDQESATLISGFFANLAAGQSKTEALRQSQINLINSRRQQYGAAHPFYWAAFTITGD